MKTGIFLEYLGEIDTDLLVQNLTNTNEGKPSIDAFREAFSRGFLVSVQIEQQIHEMPDEKKTLREFVGGRLRRAEGIDVPGRKLIGLVLTPKTKTE